MNDSDSVQQEFLNLRDSANNAHLATLSSDGSPEASYAPCICYQGDCYFFLSELASHTGNLTRNPEISLLLIESVATTANAFARRRISLHENALRISRDNDLCNLVLAEFRGQFGKVMDVIGELPDFHLFRVQARAGRFVRGFGQTYELVGEKLDHLRAVDPRR
ncbi:MAG: pyridoxamine 5'-phosphate oxidase [Gammaproteobacteria bacterium]|nr:pyridoxamine 5'-phosphate oxidase [Gammaproteobacteria bacterium]